MGAGLAGARGRFAWGLDGAGFAIELFDDFRHLVGQRGLEGDGLAGGRSRGSRRTLLRGARCRSRSRFRRRRRTSRRFGPGRRRFLGGEGDRPGSGLAPNRSLGRHGKTLFQLPDLGEPAHVPFLAGEFGREPFAADFDGGLCVQHVGSQAEDVCVVVLPALARGEEVVAERRADALDLVGGNGGAHAAAAHKDPQFDELVADGVAHGPGEIRVVHRITGERPQIQDVVTVLLQSRDNRLLQRVAGVVAAKGDAHPFLSLPGSSMSGAGRSDNLSPAPLGSAGGAFPGGRQGGTRRLNDGHTQSVRFGRHSVQKIRPEKEQIELVRRTYAGEGPGGDNLARGRGVTMDEWEVLGVRGLAATDERAEEFTGTLLIHRVGGAEPVESIPIRVKRTILGELQGNLSRLLQRSVRFSRPPR